MYRWAFAIGETTANPGGKENSGHQGDFPITEPFPGAACCHLIELPADKAAPLPRRDVQDRARNTPIEDEDDDENEDDYPMGAPTRQTRNVS